MVVTDGVPSLRTRITSAGISSSSGPTDETESLGHIKTKERVESDGCLFLQGDGDHGAFSESISIHPECIEFDTSCSYGWCGARKDPINPRLLKLDVKAH